MTILTSLKSFLTFLLFLSSYIAAIVDKGEESPLLLLSIIAKGTNNKVISRAVPSHLQT